MGAIRRGVRLVVEPVITLVGTEGMICVYNEVGVPHLVADVRGWFE